MGTHTALSPPFLHQTSPFDRSRVAALRNASTAWKYTIDNEQPLPKLETALQSPSTVANNSDVAHVSAGHAYQCQLAIPKVDAVIAQILMALRPLFLCEPYVNSQLVKGSIKTIVVLPKYVDANEWLALNGELSYRPSLAFD